MEAIYKHLEKIKEYTVIYFREAHLQYSNENYFATEEGTSNALKILDTFFEKTKRNYTEEILNFTAGIKNGCKDEIQKVLEEEKIKLEQELKNFRYDDYEGESYLSYIVHSILFEHVENLLYNIKTKEELNAIELFTLLNAHLNDYSIDYDKDVLHIFRKNFCNKNGKQ